MVASLVTQTRTPFSTSAATGLAGAATVTLAHEVLRQLVHGAPRMDRLGMNALRRALHATGVRSPRGERLRGWTLLGDVVANALSYGVLVRPSKNPVGRGFVVGTLLGLGAVVVTPLVGLPARHRGRTARAQAMTVALYAAGGVAAGLLSRLLVRRPATTAA